MSTERGKSSKKAADDKYRKTDKGKVAQKKGHAKYRKSDKGRKVSAMQRAKHKFHVSVRAVTYAAIRSGKLTREPCRDCGSINVHAHHRDYNKPFDVIWLCPQHHTDEHKRMSS